MPLWATQSQQAGASVTSFKLPEVTSRDVLLRLCHVTSSQSDVSHSRAPPMLRGQCRTGHLWSPWNSAHATGSVTARKRQSCRHQPRSLALASQPVREGV